MSTQPVEAKWDSGQTTTNEAGDEVKVYLSAVVDFDLGENLTDAEALFGADAVFNSYKANAKVQLQGAIRAQGEAGVPAEEIPSRLSAWKPGIKIERGPVDSVAVLRARYAAGDEDAKADLLQQIMGEDAEE